MRQVVGFRDQSTGGDNFGGKYGVPGLFPNCFGQSCYFYFTVLLFSTESRENPFVANSELSQKADYILTHSTITRTELDIKDPDAVNASGDAVNEVCAVAKVSTTAAVPDSHVADGRPIEVEVAKGSAVPPQPQHAEEVKLKKRKCCTVL